MKYTLLNATVVDGGKVVEGVTIQIDGEKIIGLNLTKDILEDSKVIDLSGKYVLPGLVNMHVHLAASGKPVTKDAPPKDYKKLANTLLSFGIVRKVFIKLEENLAKTELLSGVTTLRAVGGLKNFDGIVRDKINAGKILGPRIISANTAVSVPGGHFAGSLATETTSVETAIADVRAIAESGADLIKLMITGGVMDATSEGEPGALRMAPEIVEAACNEAHSMGLKVAAHVESVDGVKVALRGGVDTIEHGAMPDDEMINLFKEKKAALITTLSPALPYALFDLSESHCGELGKKNGMIVFKGIVENAKKCRELGIRVGMGTDTGCPFISHYNMWREVYYFAKYMECSNLEALRVATEENAKILGIYDVIGSIDIDKSADIIVCDKDPSKDLTALKNLSYVFAKGKMIKSPKIKKSKVGETLLDKYM